MKMDMVVKLRAKLAIVKRYCIAIFADPYWVIRAKFEKKGIRPKIIDCRSDSAKTKVDEFWSDYTIITMALSKVKTSLQSKQYLAWRAGIYPRFMDLMHLWGGHDNQVILEYGCGPANDLVGFLLYSGAKKVIGIDVSEKALKFASYRLSLHNVDPKRVELLLTSDTSTKIPLENDSVDYIFCEGVLHHTSNPALILQEFYRVLRRGGYACIMVYNFESLWAHLYVPYELQIRQGKYAKLDTLEACAKTTDSEDCPISRFYRPDEFTALCQQAGFNAEFIGGYYTKIELDLYSRLHIWAIHDARLAREHKAFLSSLTMDSQGYPRHIGKYCGIGGVYKLVK